MLDRAENRAKERVVLRARDLQGELKTALGDGGLIRRHPYIAVAAAASLGAIAAPLLLRFLRSPGRALRSASRFARAMGIPLPAYTALNFIQSVTESRGSPDVDDPA